MTVSDFPLHHFFTNVKLAGIIVEEYLGERQDDNQTPDNVISLYLYLL
jgi:hypothetical protein